MDAAVLGQDVTSIALYWPFPHALSRLHVSNRVSYFKAPTRSISMSRESCLALCAGLCTNGMSWCGMLVKPLICLYLCRMLGGALVFADFKGPLNAFSGQLLEYVVKTGQLKHLYLVSALVGYAEQPDDVAGKHFHCYCAGSLENLKTLIGHRNQPRVSVC